MALRIPAWELARTKADFDPPEEADHKGKGNPNGRPPSPVPRDHRVSATLSDIEFDMLNKAADILDISKTRVISQGIERVYAEAVAKKKRAGKERK